ncbi:MAG TPA: squalene synthase HpnC [Mycobacteriales bacterium]|nr:squalene synthase HpnC [Mycobacteriales bacterium]
MVEGRAHPGTRTVRLRRQESAENFPVAMRVLPAAVRVHLRAIYDVVRVIDNLGDDAGSPADRTAALEAFGADLATVWTTGRPSDPVLVGLLPSVRACGLQHRDFAALVEANVQDQRLTRYGTYGQLRGYCALSAAPIGRLVLAVFGATTPARVVLSDQVCDALQQLEHWQDVAEDLAGGRIYVPQEDLALFGVTEADLAAPASCAAVAELIVFETERARALLVGGSPIVGTLHGWARVAVAGYVAGGLAAADALRRRGADPLVATPVASKAGTARHALAVLARGRAA